MELGYPPAFRPPGVIWRFSLQTSVPAWGWQQAGPMVSEQAGTGVSPGHVDTWGIPGALPSEVRASGPSWAPELQTASAQSLGQGSPVPPRPGLAISIPPAFLPLHPCSPSLDISGFPPIL